VLDHPLIQKLANPDAPDKNMFQMPERKDLRIVSLEDIVEKPKSNFDEKQVKDSNSNIFSN